MKSNKEKENTFLIGKKTRVLFFLACLVKSSFWPIRSLIPSAKQFYDFSIELAPNMPHKVKKLNQVFVDDSQLFPVHGL